VLRAGLACLLIGSDLVFGFALIPMLYSALLVAFLPLRFLGCVTGALILFLAAAAYDVYLANVHHGVPVEPTLLKFLALCCEMLVYRRGFYWTQSKPLRPRHGQLGRLVLLLAALYGASVVVVAFVPTWPHVLLLLWALALGVRLEMMRSNDAPPEKFPLAYLATPILSIVILLPCLDVALRMVKIDLPLNGRGSVYQPHPQARYAARPNSQQQFGKDDQPRTLVRFNAQAIRDREFAPKLPGARRIVVIGDSFTVGNGVQQEETYAKRLEKMLAERHGNGKFEVVNLGCIGYGPYQELCILKDRGMAFEPDMVVQQVYLGNDISDELGRVYCLPEAYELHYLNFQRFQVNVEPWRWEHELGKRLPTVLFLGDAFRLWRNEYARTWFKPEARIDFRPPVERPPWAESALINRPPRMEQGWELLRETLTETHAFCEANHLPYVLFQIPDQFEIYPFPSEEWAEYYVPESMQDYDLERPSRDFEALCRQESLPGFSLYDDFIRRRDRKEADLYLPEDRHLSPHGNVAAAQKIADYLNARLLVATGSPDSE
jgi:hypothetical protein